MQVVTGADSTVILSFISTQAQLDEKIRRLGHYDGHQLTLLGSLESDDKWNGSEKMQQKIVKSDKEFGLLGREILPQEGINTVCDEKLPAVKENKAHVKLILESLPMFCKAGKIPLPLQDRA